MNVYCLGLSHRTASVEVRERFALGTGEMAEALAGLRARGEATEGVWVSTCNRVELYAVGEDRSLPALRKSYERRAGPSDAGLGNAVYSVGSPHSVEHLFRVASGLDSMVVGETEVLGQLKEAYESARGMGHTGRVLNRVFQGAFRAAKQVRSETGIQRGHVSIASLAAELAEKLFGSLEGRTVLVLGAGDTGEKVTRALLNRGVGEVRIVNRSPERGHALAAVLGPRAQVLPDWSGALAQVDVVVGSTSAPEFVLDVPRLAAATEARAGRPLLLLDLAVPRDIDPAVASLPGVRLHNIDDLQSLAAGHLRQRQAEVGRCERILRAHAREVLQRVQEITHPPTWV